MAVIINEIYTHDYQPPAMRSHFDVRADPRFASKNGFTNGVDTPIFSGLEALAGYRNRVLFARPERVTIPATAFLNENSGNSKQQSYGWLTLLPLGIDIAALGVSSLTRGVGSLTGWEKLRIASKNVQKRAVLALPLTTIACGPNSAETAQAPTAAAAVEAATTPAQPPTEVPVLATEMDATALEAAFVREWIDIPAIANKLGVTFAHYDHNIDKNVDGSPRIYLAGADTRVALGVSRYFDIASGKTIVFPTVYMQKGNNPIEVLQGDGYEKIDATARKWTLVGIHPEANDRYLDETVNYLIVRPQANGLFTMAIVDENGVETPLEMIAAAQPTAAPTAEVPQAVFASVFGQLPETQEVMFKTVGQVEPSGALAQPDMLTEIPFTILHEEPVTNGLNGLDISLITPGDLDPIITALKKAEGFDEGMKEFTLFILYKTAILHGGIDGAGITKADGTSPSFEEFKTMWENAKVDGNTNLMYATILANLTKEYHAVPVKIWLGYSGDTPADVIAISKVAYVVTDTHNRYGDPNKFGNGISIVGHTLYIYKTIDPTFIKTNKVSSQASEDYVVGNLELIPNFIARYYIPNGSYKGDPNVIGMLSNGSRDGGNFQAIFDISDARK